MVKLHGADASAGVGGVRRKPPKGQESRPQRPLRGKEPPGQRKRLAGTFCYCVEGWAAAALTAAHLQNPGYAILASQVGCGKPGKPFGNLPWRSAPDEHDVYRHFCHTHGQSITKEGRPFYHNPAGLRAHVSQAALAANGGVPLAQAAPAAPAAPAAAAPAAMEGAAVVATAGAADGDDDDDDDDDM
jgi:hypothetical protein